MKDRQNSDPIVRGTRGSPDEGSTGSPIVRGSPDPYGPRWVNRYTVALANEFTRGSRLGAPSRLTRTNANAANSLVMRTPKKLYEKIRRIAALIIRKSDPLVASYK